MNLKSLQPHRWLASSFAQLAKSFRHGGPDCGSLRQDIIDTLLFPRDYLRILDSYRGAHQKSPRVLFPKTFNEYIQHTKLFRRNERFIVFADKLAVRDHVARRIGTQFLPRIHWIGTNLHEARTLELPRRLVIKANHGSGMVLVVEDSTLFDWDDAQLKTRDWLKCDFSERFSEWQYRWITPKLFIEEFLDEGTGNVPRDFKFFCFWGKAHYIQIEVGRFGNRKRLYVDRHFRPLDISHKFPRASDSEVQTEHFASMLWLAETLAAGEPHLRIDFYDIGRPVFGEITVTSGAGLTPFASPETDLRYGKLCRSAQEQL